MTFITIDFGLKNLDLNDSSFAHLNEAYDMIVHTAWKVDLNQDLSSFAESIRSVRTTIDWTTSSARRPRMHFSSSISSVGPWNSKYDNGAGIPEAPIEDLGAALSIG